MQQNQIIFQLSSVTAASIVRLNDSTVLNIVNIDLHLVTLSEIDTTTCLKQNYNMQVKTM